LNIVPAFFFSNKQYSASLTLLVAVHLLALRPAVLAGDKAMEVQLLSLNGRISNGLAASLCPCPYLVGFTFGPYV
jgi:hypothetical protein